MKKLKLFINKSLLIFRVLIFLIIDKIAFSIKFSQLSNINEKDKIILILNLQGLGDFLIHLSTYKEIKKYFPNHKIYFLCDLKLVKLAKKLNCFDKIISINSDKFFLGNNFYRINFKYIFYRFKKIQEINRQNYDFIFNICRKELFLNILMMNLKAKNKIGFNQITFNNKFYNSIFNKAYTKVIQTEYKHFLWSIKNFFQQINPNYEIKSDEYYLPKFEVDIKEYKSLENKKYFVIALGAFDLKRTLDIKKFIALANEINTNIENIVLIGIEKEKFLGEFFEKNYSGTKNIINLIGKTNLYDLISVIKYAKFFIGSDTGTTHFAVALKTPSICILCGGS
ncbi:MAG: hypothetical protein LBF97_02290, partial [Elusimicrobiota bacterium]|nr:hypothetical protein [Elusimicrobiota bacterium]